MHLYRYIPKKRFSEIITNNELVFISPLCWKDQYEGVLFRMIKTTEGRTEIIRLLKELEKPDFIIGLLKNEAAVSLLKCLCWCKNRDSIVMWESYTDDGQSIMIQTTRDKIEGLRNQTGDHVKVEEVVYDEYIDLEDEIYRAFIDIETVSTQQIFRTKREEFSFEKEMRAYIGGAINYYDSSTYHMPLPIKIEIPINQFIEDVIVNPNASEATVREIEDICKQHSIKFSGKSKVFDFSLDRIRTT